MFLQALAKTSSSLQPMLDGCLENKRQWGILAEKNEKKTAF